MILMRLIETIGHGSVSLEMMDRHGWQRQFLMTSRVGETVDAVMTGHRGHARTFNATGSGR